MTAWLSAIIAAAVVLLVVLIAFMGWGGRMSRLERIGLFMMAAGLLWAGPARLLGASVGLGDLMFLTGLLLHLLSLYGVRLLARADALDGQVDGRINVVVMKPGGQVTRTSFQRPASPHSRRL